MQIASHALGYVIALEQLLEGDDCASGILPDAQTHLQVLFEFAGEIDVAR